MQIFLQSMFYATAIAGMAYFLVRRRSLDFFTIGFASGLVYFLPGFFGFVRSSRNLSIPEPLQPGSYVVFIAVLLSILVGAYLYDQFLRPEPSADANVVSLKLTTEVAVVIAIAGLVATILTSGDLLYSAQKSAVMESIGRWHVLFRFAAIYTLVFAILRQQRVLAVCGVLFLFFDMYVGFRVGLVIATLAAATLLIHAKGPQSLLRDERRNLLFGVLLIVAIFVYKQLYVLVKLGLWDVVANKLSNPDILFFALMTSEPFGTQSILNEVLRTEFFVGTQHLSSLASLAVPFSNLLGADLQSYNDLFQDKLFGGVAIGGMANNIWAQMYSIGGWFGIGIGVAVNTLLLGVGSWLLAAKRGSGLALTVVVFTFIAFYIHRNDISFMLVLLRRALMIWVVVVLPGMVLTDIRRSQLKSERGRPDPQLEVNEET